MTTRVFVYGTLKSGLSNHGWLRGQKLLATTKTAACYRMFDLGGYPGMVESAQGLAIQGEVWEVDAAALQQLDVLEGVAEGEYALLPVKLSPDWQGGEAKTYLYQRSIAGRPEVGDCWCE